MASRKEIPIALWRRIEPLISPVKRSPKGGRPRIRDQHVHNGIIYVRRPGIPREELLLALGDGSGMTFWRRLRDWQAIGVWQRPHQVLLAELGRAEKLDLSRASKAYDNARCRDRLRQRSSTARIPRKRIERNDRLGRHRWVVERTLAWFAGVHKRRIRFERRIDLHLGLLSLACSTAAS
ncbi:transposase [Xanthomonas fragariae]|uniref:transposase n=1 Tax=Xanthomonas fragariae TaxID=48664 RepID=UPI000D557D35